MKVIDTPNFQTEREEAAWWFENQHVIDQMFEEEFGPAPADFDFVAADVVGQDAELLRKQAAACGLAPHAYATKLLHEALQRSIQS